MILHIYMSMIYSSAEKIKGFVISTLEFAWK